jgi:hypothetical protein
MTPRSLTLIALFQAFLFMSAQDAAGQADPRIQAGIAVVPGIGVQTGYVSLRNFYTAEGLLYLDASPQFAGGEATLQVSLGLGGAIRPLGVVRTIGNTEYSGYDLYIGLRGGPALFFASEEGRKLKNQRFSLFLEPFFRLTSELGTSRTFFVELGFQRPLLRAGLSFAV